MKTNIDNLTLNSSFETLLKWHDPHTSLNPYEMCNTYMHLAAKKGQIEMFKVILDSETDNNSETVDCSNSLHALSSYKDHPYKDQVVHFRKNKDQY